MKIIKVLSVKIDSDQWLLPKFYNRIYINILILKFSGQYIRKSNFEDWVINQKETCSRSRWNIYILNKIEIIIITFNIPHFLRSGHGWMVVCFIDWRSFNFMDDLYFDIYFYILNYLFFLYTFFALLPKSVLSLVHHYYQENHKFFFIFLFYCIKMSICMYFLGIIIYSYYKEVIC
jgi:hypothetical protein